MTRSRFNDLTGKRFGRAVAIEPASRDKWGAVRWKCRCDCGSEFTTVGKVLTRGDTKSCGCFHADSLRARAKHGMSKTTLYRRWRNILTRCLNANVPSYKDYGARGISVCERWMDFRNFLEDMGSPPQGAEIERKDNNGSYSPENCIWATRATNANNKRSVAKITYLNKTQTISEWSKELRINHHTIYTRLKKGWPAPAILAKVR